MQFSEEICAQDKRNLQICHAVGSVTCVNHAVEPWVLQRALASALPASIRGPRRTVRFDRERVK